MATLKVRLPFDGFQRLTQGFGERPEVYRALGLPGHNGIDWGMVVGTPILAVDNGKVVLVDNSPDGFGLHIKLSHSWGESLYAHLDRIDMKLNQTAKVGQRVGLSGNTGFSSGPHLHFGMRVSPYNTGDGWNGYTNPQRYLDWPDAGDGSSASELEKRLADLRKELEDVQGGFVFERQELFQQADLWRVAVTEVLRRHMPGQLPNDADVLATLDALMDAWAAELEQTRSRSIAGVFGPENGSY
ncbi:MAG: peptidoglycan DD-metalloendopeptidase family protein [Caldilineales bacterium]|nr:peptidoglycan DD-metalloendopeptidase family protein [Caldilineales bacterium]